MRHHLQMNTKPTKKSLYIQRYFLTGILTLLPLWLTWFIFKFALQLLTQIGLPWVKRILSPFEQWLPQVFQALNVAWLQSIIAIIGTLLFIYLMGWATHRVIGRRLITAFDNLMQRVPLVQTIYGGAKKLLELMQTKPDGTQRVVLIDFPNRDMKTIGLVTRVLKDSRTGEELAAVYVPTTPNPTSGYLEVVPVANLTPTDLSVDQAMAFIISGGAISPDTIRFRRDNE